MASQNGHMKISEEESAAEAASSYTLARPCHARIGPTDGKCLEY